MKKEDIKNILCQIIREGRIKKGNYVLFVNQDIYDAMEEANMVVHWEENHPGAIWTHCDVCGLPVIIDQNETFFSIVSLSEARDRMFSMEKREWKGQSKMVDKEEIVDDLNVAKLVLCNHQMLTPEMCFLIGQAITRAIDLLDRAGKCGDAQ